MAESADKGLRTLTSAAVLRKEKLAPHPAPNLCSRRHAARAVGTTLRPGYFFRVRFTGVPSYNCKPDSSETQTQAHRDDVGLQGDPGNLAVIEAGLAVPEEKLVAQKHFERPEDMDTKARRALENFEP